MERTLPHLARNLLREECGTVPKLEVGFDSWIVAEGWPSWAFSLQSLGCKHMKVSSKGLSLRELACLKGTSLKDSIVPWRNLDRSMQDTRPNARPKFMWIQGSEDFVTQAVNKAKENGFTAITVCIVANSSRMPTIDPMPQSSWYKMKHSTVGGRTRGAWFVSSTLNLDLQTLNASSNVQRTLRDVLKPTVHGTALDSSKVDHLMSKQGFISGDRRVLPCRSKIKVIAPSVFSPSGFVYRLLSESELMDVYDVDEVVKQSLLHEPLSIQAQPLPTFTTQAPGKILHD